VHDANSMVARMKENLMVLSSMHSDYLMEKESLYGLPEAIAIEARTLGYIADSETVIRLPTIDREPEPPSAGERISYEPEIRLPEMKIKQLALISTLVSALIGMIYHVLVSREHRHRDILVQEDSRT